MSAPKKYLCDKGHIQTEGIDQLPVVNHDVGGINKPRRICMVCVWEWVGENAQTHEMTGFPGPKEDAPTSEEK